MLTFFAHTFFYIQLNLRLLETLQVIIFYLFLWNVCPSKFALIFCQRWLTAGFSGLLMWCATCSKIWGIFFLLKVRLQIANQCTHVYLHTTIVFTYIQQLLLLTYEDCFYLHTSSKSKERAQIGLRSIFDLQSAVCQLWLWFQPRCSCVQIYHMINLNTRTTLVIWQSIMADLASGKLSMKPQWKKITVGSRNQLTDNCYQGKPQ